MLYETMSLRQMIHIFSPIPKRITTFLMQFHFTFDLYDKATIVFDGYDGKPRTKDSTHQHRTTQVTDKVNNTNATKFVGRRTISYQII